MNKRIDFNAPTYGRSDGWIEDVTAEGILLLDREPQDALTVYEIADEIADALTKRKKRLVRILPLDVHDHVIRPLRMHDYERAAVCFTVAELRRRKYEIPDRHGSQRLHFLTEDPRLIEAWEREQAKKEDTHLKVMYNQVARRVEETKKATNAGKRARIKHRHLSRWLEDLEVLYEQEAALADAA